LPALLLLFAARAGAQEVGVPPVVADGYDRDRGVDVLHYDLAIDLPGSPGPISARARILAERMRAELETLHLDFGALAVDSVRVDGAGASWTRGDGALMVTLPTAAVGVRHEVTIWYRGIPQDGLIMRDNRHGDFAVFGDNWPDRAREWLPSVDHPSDKATFALEVTAPAAWRVIGNGYLVDRDELQGGRARTRWVETAEIPTYTMILGAAPFSVGHVGTVSGVEVTAWTFPQDSAAGAAAFARGAEIVALYDSLFGPFPYEKMAHVQSSTRYGGMENSSAIFYDERRIGEALAAGARVPGELSDDLTGLVAHETVHMWFGDAVTETDWHHLWLSEGFATYFGQVFFELRGSNAGTGPDELARRMRALRREVLAWDRESGLAIVDPQAAGPGEYEKLLHTGNYEKGAWVLHMLRREVGDESFFAGVRAFYAALRDDNAWTSDFERAMEQASGKDLGWFFAQWIGRPSHPILAVETEPGDAGRTRILVRQVQAGEPWRIAVDLEIAGSGARRERVDLTGREAAIEVEGPITVDQVTLDPDAWLLFEPGG
jgi:aminopeptidase N